MKTHEKKALIKFMMIYLVSTFILELGVAVLYFVEQRKNIVQELQNEMVSYTSLSRDGNKIEHFEDFSIEIEPARRHQYPKFMELDNSFVNIACASKYYPEDVFIVTADKSIIELKVIALIKKIAFFMGTGFIIFFGVAYYLARLSIRPIEESRKVIDIVVEDIIHDLNAPLTAIAMNCESLESTLNEAKNIKKVARIQSSNNTIRFLYTNLQLLLDRKFALKNELVDISLLLARRVEFFLEIHPKAKFNTSFEQLKFYTDYHAFERVIDNILSNAIKYSQPSPIIQIKTSNRTITIEDNGIGIEDCTKIFERNYRETQAMSCSNGIGLGLSIVKKLCDEMGVTITLESEHNKGSKFKLYCPE